ncbi:hydroxymethylbilane synthase [Helicobacter jaachi]|uniref:Porphobilinogen deaminase n=1 Tax=Helicobacter jaachi TaxID=1677920 RepID=A0A4U8T9X9_9HELI|nr:hydroxymethylbilane synthase [Helicobacter jaachi]TLD96585.1 hydroxymethylbilane synthase [Helicobacter jaachi]
MSILTIGTRGSALALWQAEYIKSRLKNECGLESQIQIIKTRGDKILDVPLAKIGGKGLFTKELEEMLLNGTIDLAVHSLKDVPVEFPPSLDLAAITQREDSRDCFLSVKYPDMTSLPKNAKVGTTSLRRSMQIKKYRSDLDTLSLRGNVQTRLEKLKNGTFDAIILAQAGITRLAITAKDVPYITPLAFMIPAMGQGALGIEMRTDSPYFKTISTLTHAETALCVSAERAFVKALNGGCQVPIGVHARYVNKALILEAIVGLPDGSECISDVQEMPIGLEEQERARDFGIQLAQGFIAKGARELLARAAQMAFA